jgi:AraC-like DNA-binding protein
VAVTILAVATRAVLATCEGLGHDAGAIAREAGLDRRLLADPDARVLPAIADRVWIAALAAAGDPDLPLRVAAAIPEGAFRVLDYVAGASETFGDALRRIASYARLIDPRASIEIIESGTGELVLRLSSRRARATAASRAPSEQFTFAAIVTRLRRREPSFSPVRVSFTFPHAHDTSEHVRIFGVLPELGAGVAELVISAVDAARRPSSADPALASILDAHARDLISRLPGEQEEEAITARVASAMPPSLHDGGPDIEEVARRLGMTGRTLQRRLREEGVSFAEILDRRRERVAREQLARRDVSLAEIAWLLGFGDQSASTRAFRRWTGETPARFRRKLGGR